MGSGRRRGRESGAVAVMAAFFVLVLGAFTALVLNIGLMMDARVELQNASDSATLAAAGSLDGTAAGITAARAAAVAYSSEHNVTNEAVAIDPAGDVRYGAWHFKPAECTFGASGSDCFEEIDPNSIDPVLGTVNYFRINATKVLNGRDDGTSRNSSLGVFFGGFLNTSRTVKVNSAAVAIGRRARVDCTIPFTLASCKILEEGELKCEPGAPAKTVTFTNATSDEIGFINLVDDANPTPVTVSEAIRNKDALCEGQDFRTGSAPVSEGNNLQPIIDALLGQEHNQVTGPCLIGTTQAVAVTNNQGCAGGDPQFIQTQPVIGFVTVRIAEVKCADGNAAVCPPPDGPAVKCTGQGGGGGGGKGGGKADDGGGGESNIAITIEILCDAPAGNPAGNGPVLRIVQ